VSYSPGFRKTHEYGQPFPEDEEPDGSEFLSCPCGRGGKELCTVHSSWAGTGFDKPVVEPGE
jgi:hypothetical protein